LNTTQKKQTTHNTAKQNCSVAFYDTRPGNEMGLFHNAPEPTRADYGIAFQCTKRRTIPFTLGVIVGGECNQNMLVFLALIVVIIN